MEQEEQQQTKTKQPFNLFGFSKTNIIGIIIFVIAFLIVLIGIFIFAYCLIFKKQPKEELPQQQQQQKKKKPKKRSDQPPQDMSKKQDEIKNEATEMLVDEYVSAPIKPAIIQESDTETEQETKDDELLD